MFKSAIQKTPSTPGPIAPGIVTVASLYPAHFERVRATVENALANHSFDQLVVYSGSDSWPHLEDIPYPFKVNAQFKALVPLLDKPNCWVIWRPSEKPVLLFLQAVSVWQLVADVPETYWSEFFDIKVLRKPEEARLLLGATDKGAFLGKVDPAIAEWDLGVRNPAALIAEMNWFRSYKTRYEQWCIREANNLSAYGHLAARDAFYQGCSEFEISLAFLSGCQQSEEALAYPSVVGLNEHAAILHYLHRDVKRIPKPHLNSFLLDAGAQYLGYASDVTRSYAYCSGLFSELIEALDSVQLALVSEMTVGKTYRELNVSALKKIAGLLVDFGVFKVDANTALELGLVENFMPHGLGHFIGLQVHDVAGAQKGPGGESFAVDSEFPTIKMHRPIEPDHVVTVEPGIYFIDALLNPLAVGPHRTRINWDKVQQLTPFGGVRIEDNVLISAGGVENLTRQAFDRLL